jgi:hypothetical protein
MVLRCVARSRKARISSAAFLRPSQLPILGGSDGPAPVFVLRFLSSPEFVGIGGTAQEATMRFLIVAVSFSALALATGASAQTTPQSPPPLKPLRNPPRRLRRARVWTLCSGSTRAGLQAKTKCLTCRARAVLYFQTGAMFALAVPRRAENISNGAAREQNREHGSSRSRIVHQFTHLHPLVP